MKIKTPSQKTTAGLLAAVLMAGLTAFTANAATPALNPQILNRPLTPGDKTVYGLPASMEVSGGLKTVAVGTPVYLEAEINIAYTNPVSVTWALTAQPVGSVAALTNSPLGTNVPIYEPADRRDFQVAGRSFLRPDATGPYTVVATITATSGTNVSTTNLSMTMTVGTYMGVGTCALCHSGGVIAQNMYEPWTNTAHSSIFTHGINGDFGFYSQSCLPCHTVGYDVNTNAANGGFDDIAHQLGWTFPTVLTNSNWANTPDALKNLANIQCENCHGPGSEHVAALGNTNAANWPRLSVTVASGDCNQCHDAPTHHIKGTEWYSSLHALTTRTPTGSASRGPCVACHTSTGFIARLEGPAATTNVNFSAIGCQTCHEPHGITAPTNNPHLLRVLGNVDVNGTTVTNAGEGSLCLKCHYARNGNAVNNIPNYQAGLPTWYGGSSFGVHDNPQGDMVEGVNGITYGQNIPSSAHRFTVTNLCVGCHMQADDNTTDPGFLKAGGHTFHMSYSVVTNGVTNIVDKVDACAQCHGPIPGFDLPKQDYNGDGVIEGVQTEVQKMLDKLSTMLPGSAYVSNGNYVADGLVKTGVSVKTNWPTRFLNAAFNWQFVNNDGSKGVHNAPFATGLLKASMADLTGDANNDGLPDAWQVQYFGSANSPNAAPNATPAGDGIPNWLKYSMGVDPTVPGLVVPGGVVWANGNTLGTSADPNNTNAIAIFTAAEVAFNTQVGVSYQLQSISSLGGGWQNVGTPIAGTGSSMSFVTPTRNNVQQFYRVVHTP